MEAGHSWKYCNARIPPASEQTSGGGSQGQNNGGETVCCLATCILGTNDDPCIEERSPSPASRETSRDCGARSATRRWSCLNSKRNSQHINCVRKYNIRFRVHLQGKTTFVHQMNTQTKETRRVCLTNEGGGKQELKLGKGE